MPASRHARPNPWTLAETLAIRCLRQLLTTDWMRSRTALSNAGCHYVAQAVQDLMAPDVLSPLLRMGCVAWKRLAGDLESRTASWPVILRKWATTGLPTSWQCHFWDQYVPYCGGAGLRLRKALLRRRSEGPAPKTFERRLVLNMERGPSGWQLLNTRFEDAKIGDELIVRIEVTQHHDQAK